MISKIVIKSYLILLYLILIDAHEFGELATFVV